MYNVISTYHFFSRQYVVPRRPSNTGHEHGSVVHESALLKNARPSGEQQLLRRQHQHRARRLRVVWGPARILGSSAATLRKEQRKLLARVLVAEDDGTEGSRNPVLQIHAEARRLGLGQCRLRSLGSGCRLVQQHCLERRPHDFQAVHHGPGAIRVEQDATIPVNRRHGLAQLEPRQEHCPFGHPALRSDQVDLSQEYMPDRSNSEFRSVQRSSGSIPRPEKERPGSLLQRLRGGGVQHALYQSKRKAAHGPLFEVRAQEQPRSEGLDVSGGVPSQR